MTRIWTDEELQVLRRLKAQKDFTARQIGDEVGRTRCSVLGAIHRHLPEMVGKEPKRRERAPDWRYDKKQKPLPDVAIIDPRPLVSRIVGDPMPGRSALDHMLRAKKNVVKLI